MVSPRRTIRDAVCWLLGQSLVVLWMEISRSDDHGHLAVCLDKISTLTGVGLLRLATVSALKCVIAAKGAI